MKTNVISLMIGILALVLSSCENKEDPNNYIPLRYDMFVDIINVSNPELLQYVVAEEVPILSDTTYSKYGHMILRGDSSEYKICMAGGVYEELFLGTNPYIHLTDDYYLVDWKWGNFLYEPSNVLLDVKWEDVMSRQQVWSIETPLIASRFPCQLKYLKRETIDKFLGIEPSSTIDTDLNLSIDYAEPWFIWKFNTQEEFLDGVKAQGPLKYATIESYQAEVARQDSLQKVYVERLKQVIKEGQLQNLLKD